LNSAPRSFEVPSVDIHAHVRVAVGRPDVTVTGVRAVAELVEDRDRGLSSATVRAACGTLRMAMVAAS
jgi:hypothetical protein